MVQLLFYSEIKIHTYYGIRFINYFWGLVLLVVSAVAAGAGSAADSKVLGTVTIATSTMESTLARWVLAMAAGLAVMATTVMVG